jgi:hypothetical protein|nr:MAG TPA: hypothetical protein [Caudoviricetes sp.]
MKNNLLSRLKEVMSNNLPFMEGREKADQIIGEPITIIDYGYLTGDDGEFIVYITREYNGVFFFGGSVLSEKFKELENAFTEDEMKELLEMGIKVRLCEKTSKNRRKYVSVELIVE